MFTNVGKKLKGLAKALCWLGIIVSVILGMIIISGSSESYQDADAMVIGGILTILLGALLSWIGSLGLYGFGELVDAAQHMDAWVSLIQTGSLSGQPEAARQKDRDELPWG